MSTIQIAFEVTATAHQTVKIIDDKYTEEDIINELNNGLLITTTWYDTEDNRENHIEELSGHKVARIISQQIDGDYDEFR